jgi:hypothetical protein
MQRPPKVKGSWSEGDWAGQKFEFRETLDFIDDPEEDLDSVLRLRSEEFGHKQDSYAAYLLTDYWGETRHKKLKQVGNRCEACGSEDQLQIHHKRYPARYTEANNLHLLQVLCSDCHHEQHQ